MKQFLRKKSDQSRKDVTAYYCPEECNIGCSTLCSGECRSGCGDDCSFGCGSGCHLGWFF